MDDSGTFLVQGRSLGAKVANILLTASQSIQGWLYLLTED